MQTIVGRLTADATINETKNGRKVVNFTIAKNDRFKKKGSEEYTNVPSFYRCSYWLNTNITEHLKKGMLIEITSRVGINIWNNLDGEAKGTLTLNVNNIQLHGKAKAGAINNNAPAAEATEDLPF